jgi:hypothetical protein
MGDHRLSDDIMHKLRYEPFTRKKMTRRRYKVEIETAERLGAYDIFLGEDSSKFYTAKSMFNDMVKGMPANEMSKMVQSLEVPINYWEYYHKVPSNLDVSKLDTTEWDAGYVLYHLLSYVRDKELISPTDLEMRLQLAKMHGNYDVYGYETGKITEKQLIIYAAQEFREREMKDHHKNVTTWRMTVFTSSWQLLRMLADNMSPDQYNMMINTMVVPRNFRLYNFGEPYSELPKSKRYGVNIFTLTAALIYLVTTGRLKPIVESKSELPAVHKVELPKEVKQIAAATSAIPLINMLFTSYKGIKYPFPRDDLTPSYPQTIDTFIKSRQYRVCLSKLVRNMYDWTDVFSAYGSSFTKLGAFSPLPYEYGQVYHKYGIPVTVIDSFKSLNLYIADDGLMGLKGIYFGLKQNTNNTADIDNGILSAVNDEASKISCTIKYNDDFTKEKLVNYVKKYRSRTAKDTLSTNISTDSPAEMIKKYGLNKSITSDTQSVDIDGTIKAGINGSNRYHVITIPMNNLKNTDMETSFSTILSRDGTDGGHMNSLLIDYKTNTAIYYEPHGSNYMFGSDEGIGYNFAPTHIFKAYFESMGWTYIQFMEGVQSLDSLCQTWSILLPLMHMLNDSIDISKLYTDIQGGKFKYTIVIAFLYHTCKNVKEYRYSREKTIEDMHQDVTNVGDMLELAELVESLNEN